jgi:hypothetical protein
MRLDGSNIPKITLGNFMETKAGVKLNELFVDQCLVEGIAITKMVRIIEARILLFLR